jgi:hypothetical protein
MYSISSTRENQPPAFWTEERQRCSDMYVAAKRERKRVEREHTKMLLDMNSAYGLATAYFRSGVVLRRINLFSLAIEQFDRAYQLLVLF